MPKTNSLFQRNTTISPLILIVEDDEDTRVMMKYLLNLWSYEVIEAVDGEEGIQIAEDFSPDVILMDYSLPKMNGLTATERIRELPMHGKTPIIFISAFAEPTARASAFAAGANDFLVKPIDFGQLENSLDIHFKNGYRQPEILIGGIL